MRFMRNLAIVSILLAGGSIHAQETKTVAYDLPARKAQVVEKIDAEIKSLDALYKHLHSHPELSYEEEKTAEHECIRIDDPLEVGLAEPEILLNRGQSDVHDRRVENHHELRDADKNEDHPGVRRGAHGAPIR